MFFILKKLRKTYNCMGVSNDQSLIDDIKLSDHNYLVIKKRVSIYDFTVYSSEENIDNIISENDITSENYESNSLNKLSLDNVDLFDWTYNIDNLYWVFKEENETFHCIAVFKNKYLLNIINHIKDNNGKYKKYYIIQGKRGEFVTFFLNGKDLILNRENLELDIWKLETNVIDNIIFTCKKYNKEEDNYEYATYQILTI